MKKNYLLMYRELCGKTMNTEEDYRKFDEECFEIFSESLKNGDYRMAKELQDVILTAVENEVPVKVILRDYTLLVKYFPEVAEQTLEYLND